MKSNKQSTSRANSTALLGVNGMANEKKFAPTKEQKSIVSNDGSKSSKIRALAEQGVARADIARLLGIKYQFVRNVLEQQSNKA